MKDFIVHSIFNSTQATSENKKMAVVHVNGHNIRNFLGSRHNKKWIQGILPSFFCSGNKGEKCLVLRSILNDQIYDILEQLSRKGLEGYICLENG